MAQRWLATRPPSQVVLFRRRTLAWSDEILACQAGSRAGRGRLRGHSCLFYALAPDVAPNVRNVSFLARGDALRLGATPAVVHLITGVAAPAPGLSGVLPQYRFGHASQSGEDLGIIVGGRQMRYTMCLFRLRCCGRRVLGHPTRRRRYSLILRLLERRWGWPPVAPAARWESGPVPAIERPRLSAPQSAASDALTGPQAHVWCSRVLSR